MLAGVRFTPLVHLYKSQVTCCSADASPQLTGMHCQPSCASSLLCIPTAVHPHCQTTVVFMQTTAPASTDRACASPSCLSQHIILVRRCAAVTTTHAGHLSKGQTDHQSLICHLSKGQTDHQSLICHQPVLTVPQAAGVLVLLLQVQCDVVPAAGQAAGSCTNVLIHCDAVLLLQYCSHHEPVVLQETCAVGQQNREAARC